MQQPLAVESLFPQLESSWLLLGGFLAAGLLVALLYQIGILSWCIRAITQLVVGLVTAGFLAWKRLLSWLPWPLFLIAVVGIHFAHLSPYPVVELAAGALLLFLGVITCLAYLYLDAERDAVARGYKALHNPLKGQQLATDLVRHGPRAGIPLLLVASLAVVLGFALLNEGLFCTIGRDWYRLADPSPAKSDDAGPVTGPREPTYLDFLAYTLINLARVVDLLNIASAYNVAHVTYVHQARWPASTLLLLFRSFFTLVLVQQIVAAIRRSNLLSQCITDFWSPHAPIHERAQAGLVYHGAAAVRPLLRSLRDIEYLTPEQRQELPRFLAELGPHTVPVLIHHLADPSENVRAVAVSTLGQLHALTALPHLSRLNSDSSDLVRQGLADTLAVITASGPRIISKKWFLGRFARTAQTRWGWLKRLLSWRSPLDPIQVVVQTLRQLLLDSSPAVRNRAALSLGQLGPAAVDASPVLMDLLQDEDESVRCQAAEALGRVGGDTETVNQALAGLLRDASIAVRTAGARALGLRKQEAASVLSALVVLLHDSDAGVREVAAEAIAQIGTLTEEVSQRLATGLSSPDTVLRAQTAEVLGTLGNVSETLPALIKALQDDNDQVRANAVEAIKKQGPAAAEAVPGLIQALSDPDNRVSALAAAALGELGADPDRAVPALIGVLSHINAEVRAAVAEAIGKLDGAGDLVAQALKRATQDADGSVRARAVLALARVTPPGTSTDGLLGAMEDPDPRVRVAAVQALAPLASREAVRTALLQAIHDPSGDVKVQVANVLGEMQLAVPAATEGLGHLLGDDTVVVQVSAARALGRLGPAAASMIDSLAHALLTGGVELRRQVIHSLALIDPPAALPTFLAALNDDDPEVRKLASAGLLKVPQLPAEVAPALIDALGDPDVRVRANAAQALGTLDPLPSDAIAPLLECTANANDRLRLNATRSLARAGSEAVNGTFVGLLDDPSSSVRQAAAQSLLSTDPQHPAALAALEAMQNEPQEEVC
jgi:HEAT repeat protein